MMARRYGSFTPARRAALRRAQLASAAKRRGRRRSRNPATRYVQNATTQRQMRRRALGIAGGALVGSVVLGATVNAVGQRTYVPYKIKQAHVRQTSMSMHPSAHSGARGLSGIKVHSDADKFYHTAYTQRKDRLTLIKNPNPNLKGKRPNSRNYIRRVK
jgi:hypothetical protein